VAARAIKSVFSQTPVRYGGVGSDDEGFEMPVAVAVSESASSNMV
jgi:hypothetical protein